MKRSDRGLESRVSGIPRRYLVQDESDNITIPPADQKTHATAPYPFHHVFE
jgi:hypothetical protein